MSWYYQFPRRKLRFIFFPTAFIGALGILASLMGFIRFFQGHEINLLFFAALLCVSSLFLWMGISVLTLKVSVKLENSIFILERKTFFSHGTKKYFLKDFDYVELNHVVASKNTHQVMLVPNYWKVVLRGKNHNLHLASETNRPIAYALAEEISQLTSIPLHEI